MSNFVFLLAYFCLLFLQVMLLFVWCKIYINLFLSVYLCFPLATTENLSREAWIFPSVIRLILFHCVLCVYGVKGAGVEEWRLWPWKSHLISLRLCSLTDYLKIVIITTMIELSVWCRGVWKHSRNTTSITLHYRLYNCIQLTTGSRDEGNIFKILPHPANSHELRLSLTFTIVLSSPLPPPLLP